MPPAHSPQDNITRFERGVVFRVARGYFFLAAVGAVLAFVVGIALGLRGLLATQVAKPPAVVRKTSLSDALSYREVVARRKQETEAKARLASELGSTPKATAASRPQAANSGETEIQALARELRALLPDPPYSWDNVVENYCAEATDFGCLRRDVRIKKRGMVGTINGALAGLDEDTFLHMLKVLIAVLKESPVAERGDLIGPIVEMEKDRMKARSQEEAAYSAAVQRQEEEYAKAATQNDERHAQWRQIGLYLASAGLGSLVVVSLFLAFLSMERNLRLLERLIPRAAVGETESRAEQFRA